MLDVKNIAKVCPKRLGSFLVALAFAMIDFSCVLIGFSSFFVFSVQIRLHADARACTSVLGGCTGSAQRGT